MDQRKWILILLASLAWPALLVAQADCPAVPNQYTVSLDPCRAVELLDRLRSSKKAGSASIFTELENVAPRDLQPFVELAASASRSALLEVTDLMLDALWGRATSELAALGIEHRPLGPRTHLIDVSPEELQVLRARIGESKLLSFLQQQSILAIEPNFLLNLPEPALQPRVAFGAAARPNDPFFDHQWAVKTIDLDDAWSHGHVGGPTFPIAVIDSGYVPGHPDLVGNLWSSPEGGPGRAFCQRCGPSFDPHDLQDTTGHGTAVAGIIGAVTNNRYGIAGVNWYADLMILKAFHDGGRGAISDVAEAIYYAVGRKAGVITAAWGGSCRSAALFTALRAAEIHDVLVIAAAGNDARNLDAGHNEFYPASYKHFCPGFLRNMIVVGGTDCRPGRETCTTSREKTAHFSNWGETTVELGAPAVRILAPGLERIEARWPVGMVQRPDFAPKEAVEVTGTSAATALVAGAAALVASSLAPTPNDPRPTVGELRCRLLCGATKPDALKTCLLHGSPASCFRDNRRLNVWGALNADCADEKVPVNCDLSSQPPLKPSFSSTRPTAGPRPAGRDN